MKEENIDNSSNFVQSFDKMTNSVPNDKFVANLSNSTLLVNESAKNQQEKYKPENHRYGKNAIAQVLVNINFPCNKTELIKLIGDKQIEYRKGYLIKFRDAIRNCFDSHYVFNSSTDVIFSVSTYLDSMGLSERTNWLSEEAFW